MSTLMMTILPFNIYADEEDGGGESDDSDDGGEEEESDDSGGEEEENDETDNQEESEDDTESTEEEEDTDEAGEGNDLNVINGDYDEEDGSSDEESEEEPKQYEQSIDEDIADLEDDLAIADTDEKKERIQGMIDDAKSKQQLANGNFGGPTIVEHEDIKNPTPYQKEILKKIEEDKNYGKNDKKKHHDNNNNNKKVIIKKKVIHHDDDDDDNDNISDKGAYAMGYRDGIFDKQNNMRSNGVIPFNGDDDAEEWYLIGYNSGWNSISSDSQVIVK